MLKLAFIKDRKVKIKKEKKDVYKIRQDGKFRFQLYSWAKNAIKGKLWIVMGSDKLYDKAYEPANKELFNIPHIVILRKKSDIKNPVLREFNELLIMDNGVALSSSNIRRKINSGKKIRQALSPNVYRYILANGLYRP